MMEDENLSKIMQSTRPFFQHVPESNATPPSNHFVAPSGGILDVRLLYNNSNASPQQQHHQQHCSSGAAYPATPQDDPNRSSYRFKKTVPDQQPSPSAVPVPNSFHYSPTYYVNQQCVRQSPISNHQQSSVPNHSAASVSLPMTIPPRLSAFSYNANSNCGAGGEGSAGNFRNHHRPQQHNSGGPVPASNNILPISEISAFRRQHDLVPSVPQHQSQLPSSPVQQPMHASSSVPHYQQHQRQIIHQQQQQGYTVPTVTRIKQPTEYISANQGMYDMDSVVSQPSSSSVAQQRKSSSKFPKAENSPFKTTIVNNSSFNSARTKLSSPMQHKQPQSVQHVPSYSNQQYNMVPQSVTPQISQVIHHDSRKHDGNFENQNTNAGSNSSANGNIQKIDFSRKLTEPVAVVEFTKLDNGKRESPLDLSVKTVRQSADSTAADDHEGNTRPYFEMRHSHLPQIPTWVSTPSSWKHRYPARSTTESSSPYKYPSTTILKNDLNSSRKMINSSDSGAGSTNGIVGIDINIQTTTILSYSAGAASSANNGNDLTKHHRHLYESSIVKTPPKIVETVKGHDPTARFLTAGKQSSATAAVLAAHPVTPDGHRKRNSAALMNGGSSHASSDTGVFSHPQYKLPRLGSWRETIDKEIDNRLNSYIKTTQQSKNIEIASRSNTHQQLSPQIVAHSPSEKPNVHNSAADGDNNRAAIKILKNTLEIKEKAAAVAVAAASASAAQKHQHQPSQSSTSSTVSPVICYPSYLPSYDHKVDRQQSHSPYCPPKISTVIKTALDVRTENDLDNDCAGYMNHPLSSARSRLAPLPPFGEIPPFNKVGFPAQQNERITSGSSAAGIATVNGYAKREARNSWIMRRDQQQAAMSSVLSTDIHTAEQIIRNEKYSSSRSFLTSSQQEAVPTSNPPLKFRTKAELKQVVPLVKQDPASILRNAKEENCTDSADVDSNGSRRNDSVGPVTSSSNARDTNSPDRVPYSTPPTPDTDIEVRIPPPLIIDLTSGVAEVILDNNHCISKNAITIQEIDKTVPPRKRLFNRTEEDAGSSSGSIKDFDSRRTDLTKDKKEERSEKQIKAPIIFHERDDNVQASDDDLLWKAACDELVEQLSNKLPRKRGRKKKFVDATDMKKKEECENNDDSDSPSKEEESPDKQKKEAAPVVTDPKALATDKNPGTVSESEDDEIPSKIPKMSGAAEQAPVDSGKKGCSVEPDDKRNTKKKSTAKKAANAAEEKTVSGVVNEDEDGNRTRRKEKSVPEQANNSSEAGKHRNDNKKLSCLTSSGKKKDRPFDSVESLIERDAEQQRQQQQQDRTKRSGRGIARFRIQNYWEEENMTSSDSDYDAKSRKDVAKAGGTKKSTLPNSEDSEDSDSSLVRYKVKLAKEKNKKTTANKESRNSAEDKIKRKKKIVVAKKSLKSKLKKPAATVVKKNKKAGSKIIGKVKKPSIVKSGKSVVKKSSVHSAKKSPCSKSAAKSKKPKLTATAAALLKKKKTSTVKTSALQNFKAKQRLRVRPSRKSSAGESISCMAKKSQTVVNEKRRLRSRDIIINSDSSSSNSEQAATSTSNSAAAITASTTSTTTSAGSGSGKLKPKPKPKSPTEQSSKRSLKKDHHQVVGVEGEEEEEEEEEESRRPKTRNSKNFLNKTSASTARKKSKSHSDLEDNSNSVAATVTDNDKKNDSGTNSSSSSSSSSSWERDLFCYKYSLRMPLKLINISKPANWPRSDSTSSLPDLDRIKPDLLMMNKYSRASSTDHQPEQESDKIPRQQRNKTVKGIGNGSSSSANDNEKSSPRNIAADIATRKSQSRSPNDKNNNDNGSSDKNDRDSVRSGGGALKPGDIVSLLNDPCVGFFRKETVQEYREIFEKHNHRLVERYKKNGDGSGSSNSKNAKTAEQLLDYGRPASAPPHPSHDVNRSSSSDDCGSGRRKKPVAAISTPLAAGLKPVLKDLARLRDELLRTRMVEDYFLKVEQEDMIRLEHSVDSVCKLEDMLKSSYSKMKTLVSKKKKNRTVRRKCRSSGFDYIRKKKKPAKSTTGKEEFEEQEDKKKICVRPNRESIVDIQNEIRNWVVNKGIGETILHRAARLGYADIIVYCLEKLEYSPSAADNAGYTPLHEACTRGHIKIAKILLGHGADVSASAKGGIRPLHEAVENGDIELIRLLLSYGADPLLATYSGQTPISLLKDDQNELKEFLTFYLADIDGSSAPPWPFSYYNVLDAEEIGYDPLADPPTTPSDMSSDELEFEFCDAPLPSLYRFRDDFEYWVLLAELPPRIRDLIKRRLEDRKGLKFISLEISPSSFETDVVSVYFMEKKPYLKDFKTVTLIKYTEELKTLLKINKVNFSVL